MECILVYTENHEPGGGNRYITDFLDCVPSDIHVALFTNKGAFSSQDRQRLSRRFDVMELPIRSEGQTLKALSEARGMGIARFCFRVFIKLPFFRQAIIRIRRSINRGVFRRLVPFSECTAAIAFNGGFPAALSTLEFVQEAKKAGLRTALSIVSMPTVRSYRDHIYTKVLQSTDVFIVNCSAIAEAMIKTRGIPPERVRILYNTVQESGSEAPAPTESASKPPRFGFIGRLERSKGVYLLIEAFSKCTGIPAGTTLSMYGKVYNELELAQAISLASPIGAIQVKGPFAGSVYDVLNSIDVLVLPSFREGFPYVLLEAMSKGIPVIASRVGGIPEAVEQRVTGLLVEPGNCRQLAEAIGELARDPVLRCRLGNEGRLRLQDRYGWIKYRTKVSSILLDILERV